MGQRLMSVHGFEFGIDTSDWGSHSATGDVAADYLEAELSTMSREDAERLHKALQAAVNDEATVEQNAIISMAGNIADECRRRAFEVNGWAEHPNQGHNCYIYAV